ncbi:hypothetical protein E3P99_04016 [Wallemia hederae]|uniref:Deacetylase sirtuin-type domain-containing protein n=1 Tax=Wallemia hederae TaxID=1540922 RepID=A0A4T0FC45_9BASI|nr:hypothetical protein E3P99_04016 [Wallemia hederae]
MQEISLSEATLENKKALEALNSKIIKSKRVIVVSGAGISCSSGIPDFRSPQGLYNLVKDKYDGPLGKGQDLFDAQVFRDPSTTSFFYTFIAGLKKASDSALPSPTHKFIKNLESKGKLLHSYTQNVDGLEERVGLEKLVNLHGSLNQVRCASCSFVGAMSSEYLDTFASGQSPKCPECDTRATERNARGKRPLAVGRLRPGIVLYNENHWSGDSIAKAQTADAKKKPDLLIVMGTSLKVHGLRQLVKGFARNIHQNNYEAIDNPRKTPGNVIFVNATPAAGKEWSQDFDYFVNGTSDEFVTGVVEQWKSMRPQDWQRQTTITQSHKSTKKTVASGNAKGVKGRGGSAKGNAASAADEAKTSDSATHNQPQSVSVGFPQATPHSLLHPPASDIDNASTEPMKESNRIVAPNVSPKSRKRNTNTSSATNTVRRSVSSAQKGTLDANILKKNKSEDLSINFDLKLGEGSETEPEEDEEVVYKPKLVEATPPTTARRSVRIKNSVVAAAA